MKLILMYLYHPCIPWSWLITEYSSRPMTLVWTYYITLSYSPLSCLILIDNWRLIETYAIGVGMLNIIVIIILWHTSTSIAYINQIFSHTMIWRFLALVLDPNLVIAIWIQTWNLSCILSWISTMLHQLDRSELDTDLLRKNILIASCLEF